MADEKPTRGRPSKVDLLPDTIRDALHQMLRDKRHTQEEIREAINALIDQHELPDDMQLSRTGLNRYASRMEAIGSKIRASREMAEIWAAKLGSAPTSDVGKLLMEFVKTLAFETSMSLAEEEGTVAPKALGQLALVAQPWRPSALKFGRRGRWRRSGPPSWVPRRRLTSANC